MLTYSLLYTGFQKWCKSALSVRRIIAVRRTLAAVFRSSPPHWSQSVLSDTVPLGTAAARSVVVYGCSIQTVTSLPFLCTLSGSNTLTNSAGISGFT